jgi:hypothetical protein
MPDLKLPRLPDRTPVKLTINVPPDLNEALARYAQAYAEQYGTSESVADLAPYMLRCFLDSDRAFSRRPQRPA